MKKILLIMLLTFTTFAIADDRFQVVSNQDGDGGVYIFDWKLGYIKFCKDYLNPSGKPKRSIECSNWTLTYNDTDRFGWDGSNPY